MGSRTMALLRVLVALAALSCFALADKKGKKQDKDKKGKKGDDDDEDELVSWYPCYENFGSIYECAIVQVPAVYKKGKKKGANKHVKQQKAGKKGGEMLPIALTRIPATNMDDYRGSLFLNPGGPSGSGVDFAIFAGPDMPFIYGDVVHKYDLVGFDPRGVSRSAQLRCFVNQTEQGETFHYEYPWPTLDDLDEFFAQATNLNNACLEKGGDIATQMSSANVARDLDVLRDLLGNDKLNYIGLSYGTVVGAIYANLFPDNVGAVILDGVVDSKAWVNEECKMIRPIDSEVGSLAALDEFFRQCDTSSVCAFGPDSEARYYTLLANVEASPIEFANFLFDERALIDTTIGPLYDPFELFTFAEDLAYFESVYANSANATAMPLEEEMLGRLRYHTFPPYDNGLESFFNIFCTDGCLPDWELPQIYEEIDAIEARNGIFTKGWNYQVSLCFEWTIEDENSYSGSFETTTATPILLMNPLYDPATPIEGATKMHERLRNSVLVSVDMPSHTTFFIPGCAAVMYALYLEDPTTAAETIPDGLVCDSPVENWIDFVGGARRLSDDDDKIAALRKLRESGVLGFPF